MSCEESQDAPQPEIVVDDDWKQRVKAENAALDQTLKEEQQQKEQKPASNQPASNQPATTEEPTAMPDIDAQPLPPAEFATLVSMFSTQAMVSLGVVPNPLTGKAEVQLPLAQHFIDLLAVLDKKTKGNLNVEEQSMLDSSLHHLRMAYVELTKKDDSGAVE